MSFPKRVLTSACTCAALLLAGGTASAQSDTLEVALSEIVVEHERPVRRHDLLDLSVTGAQDLGQAMAGGLGLYVQRYTPGGAATPRSRGWDGAHAAVVLDGVRLIDPHSGQVDLSLLPTAFLESAELTRSVATDQGAMGGTVHLRLLQPTGPHLLRVSGGAGGFGGRSGSVVAGLAAGGASLTLGLDGARAPESWPLADGARRLGAGRDRVSVMAQASVKRGWLTWRLTHLSGFTDTALPGPANDRPRRASQEEYLIQNVLSARGVRGRAFWRLNAGFQRSEAGFSDLDAGVTRDSGTDRLHGDVSRTRGAWQVKAGLSREYLQGGQRQETAAYGDVSFGRGGFSAGMRQEIRSGAYFLVPRAAFRHARRGVTVRMSAGRSLRHPTFVERYWQPGGNPALAAEVGWAADLGISVQRGEFSAQLTGFAARLSNRIVWQPSLVASGLQVWKPINVGRAVSRGVEARAMWAGAKAAAGFDASWTRALDRSDRLAASWGHQLRYVPRLMATVPVSLQWNAWTLHATGRFTGARPIASDASFSEPAYTELDMSVGRRWSGGSRTAAAVLTVHNVLDIPFETVRLYPMPGRHLTVRLTLDFS